MALKTRAALNLKRLKYGATVNSLQPEDVFKHSCFGIGSIWKWVKKSLFAVVIFLACSNLFTLKE